MKPPFDPITLIPMWKWQTNPTALLCKFWNTIKSGGILKKKEHTPPFLGHNFKEPIRCPQCLQIQLLHQKQIEDYVVFLLSESVNFVVVMIWCRVRGSLCLIKLFLSISSGSLYKGTSPLSDIAARASRSSNLLLHWKRFSNLANCEGKENPNNGSIFF